MRWGPAELAQLEAATALALASGHRVLQTHRLAPSDREHVRLLLDWLAPPPGALVLDAGCGVGEVARIMTTLRPDLHCVLANISPLQLARCPVGPAFTHLHANCEALPLEPATVDAVMFHSALTQMNARAALAEAARVLKPGGVVSLFEMAHAGADPDAFEAATSARVHTVSELIGYGFEAGLNVRAVDTPPTDDSQFRAALRERGQQALMAPVFAVLMRFVKGAG
jgi:ubiquinone/menaquinone biosynthesis C-methylase UbiE